MSSIITSSDGLRRIEVIVGARRKRIRLGRMSARDAAALQVRIDSLARAKSMHRRDPDAEKWCDGLSPQLRAKLVKAGLLRVLEDETLAGLVSRFNASRGHVKASTLAADKQATASLVEFFSRDRFINSITPLEAQDWLQSMIGLADATVAKRVIKARSVFAQAVRWGLIERNPLSDLHAGSQENKARIRFIDDSTSRTVLDACPDAEWRCIFALARWGGLRIPSESSRLKWADVFFSEKKIRVTSPKTAHHKGGGERWMVLLPKLEKTLLDLHEQVEPWTEFVLSTKRRSATNLRTNMTKIVERAGLTVWPRLFHNLRGTVETELTLQHPLHVVCNWLGNSVRVAQAHYLSVPDSMFRHAAQIAAQQTAAVAGSGEQKEDEKPENRVDGSESVGTNGRYRAKSLRESLRKLFISRGCGANCGALADEVVALVASSPVPAATESGVGK